ncbi:MAG: hypothetical protein JWP02_1800, partial [Acidimicrobiales bacterium]|nr:hypothetical protein [Acidimicrobiales bacterium]
MTAFLQAHSPVPPVAVILGSWTLGSILLAVVVGRVLSRLEHALVPNPAAG